MKSIRESYFPVFEWSSPKKAIMGGFTLDEEKMKCQEEYLSFLEKLSGTIEVLYFTNSENQHVIQSKIDTTNIEFVGYQLDSIWIRDYAPIWLECRDLQSLALANFPYGANHFGKSEQDDNFSKVLSEIVNLSLDIDFPRKQIPYYFDGGNIFVDEELNCFTAIRKDDPPKEFREKLLAHINCHKLVVMNAIPGEGTGHVDTFMKILPNKRALLAKYNFGEFEKAMNENKEILIKCGYEVIEIEHSNAEGQTNWSYLNSLLVEDKVFVPQYQIEEDQRALAIYDELGYKAIPINARSIMMEKGSLHCITNFIY